MTPAGVDTAVQIVMSVVATQGSERMSPFLLLTTVSMPNFVKHVLACSELHVVYYPNPP
jgi:hypothetical protein